MRPQHVQDVALRSSLSSAGLPVRRVADESLDALCAFTARHVAARHFPLHGVIMGNKLYVGNLPYSYTDHDMESAFSAFGAVNSAKVIMDRDSGRSKGFGFVEMSSPAEANAAIQGLHGTDIGGRDMVVNEAKPMEPRAPRAGGYGGGNRY
jgi:cold-inducible RNA-binding protein